MSTASLISAVFGTRYRSQSLGDLRIHTDLPKTVTDQCLTLAHHARQRVEQFFPELDFTSPNKHWDIIITSTQDDLLAYLSAVSPPGSGPSIIPGGTFIPRPEPHFLMPYHELDSLDGALAHELVHAAMRGKRRPLWLEEGLAVSVEINMGHLPHPLSDIDKIRDLRGHYQHHQPKQIVDPAVFGDPETSEHSYALAFLMVSSLLRQRERFFEFTEVADPNDGGRAALESFYGVDIDDFAYHSVFPIKQRFSIRAAIRGLFGRT